VRQLSKAVAIDPHDPDQVVWLGIGWTYAGRPAHARPLFERLLQTDPLFDVLMWGCGFDAHFNGDWARAEEYYARGIRLTPDHPGAPLVLAQVVASMGETDRAIGLIAQGSHDPASHPLATLAHIFMHALRGDAAAADALATSEWASAIWSDFQYTWIMAQAQAILGRPDEALRWLTRATERGFIHHPFLSEGDPLLAGLHGHPRFVALMDQVRERWERFEAAVETSG
jgi:tetratricopeptide (TPR) repeat protein